MSAIVKQPVPACRGMTVGAVATAVAAHLRTKGLQWPQNKKHLMGRVGVKDALAAIVARPSLWLGGLGASTNHLRLAASSNCQRGAR